jgi:K+-sensing histidine kinase KdpD
MRPDELFASKSLRYGISLAAVGLTTILLRLIYDQVNLTTVALAFILVVLSSATFFGRNPALLASFAAMLSFNYLFIPPVFTWHIADPQNLVAWAAFTITAIIAGELSSYARRRAREAEKLYTELETAFEKATQAEALKQSEKLKSALLDAVTHDLRTPLTSIKASVTTLLDSEGGHRTIELNGTERAEFLHIINEETDRLNKFIDGIVELARVEAGSATANGALSNVEECIAIALERAEGILADHHLTLNLQKELPLIRVDARAVGEVLYNLIENAVKYSPAGTTITITATREDGRISIAVADEGKGIPVEMRDLIFEKFVRGSSGSEGLGLGLAIARGIVEAQNGSIEVRDGAGGKGAVFVVAFPTEEE